MEESVMVHWTKFRWPTAMGIGLALGLVLSGLWPHTPLHAVSTDRGETYAIATGPVDNEFEAVYFLDFLTGDLGAVVLGKQVGTWTGFFRTNVSEGLGVDPQKNPKFLMVTGLANLRRSGGTRMQPSAAMCYVAEVSSGKVAAYAIPWSPSMHAANQVQNGALVMVAAAPFRQTGAHSGTGTRRGREREKEQ
jgi:hypothetical protein